MPSLSALPVKQDFFSLSPHAFDAIAIDWGWPKFRANQVRDWVYKKGIIDTKFMTNLSKLDREKLSSALSFGDSEIAAQQHSEDGTIKLLLRWPAGASAETVMIPDGQRFTACVSSQVGCPVGCKFCASGIGGVKGNLTAGQIVEQIIRLNQVMKPNDTGKPNAPGRASDAPRITNVVFMGMGEPLANYANVLSAIRILHDPNCLNLGARRMTISTVGVPPKIRELAREDLPLNLAISLHAPNEQLRRELIPWAEHFSIDEILSAARYYFEQTGREITLEYILLAGVNDRPEHARQLARVCQTLRANVNLIRYNEVASLPFGRPKSDDVVTFQSILRHNGINAHVRKSRGRDIDAACGQLRRKELVQLGS
ncbi:MAG: 23S rRNA (adenine(2503)-C(2))-methyltransferase RlmN [Anaerolineae bacterium]|nr:23S rRNA (adenine(2503)-C(2))-methyltransferase RlmN [Phycisphaerae bacterium]